MVEVEKVAAMAERTIINVAGRMMAEVEEVAVTAEVATWAGEMMMMV